MRLALVTLALATAACGDQTDPFTARNAGRYAVVSDDTGPCGGALASSPASSSSFVGFELVPSDVGSALDFYACPEGGCVSTPSEDLTFTGRVGALVPKSCELGNATRGGGTLTCRQVISRELKGGVEYVVYDATYPDGTCSACGALQDASTCTERRLVAEHVSYP